MGLITDVILPLALAFIMFSLGLTLTFADFKQVFIQPKNFIVGMFSQMILLPLIGLALVFLWGDNLRPELAMGVMLIAVAPGGVTSNILTSLGRGDVALSISMTAITSLVVLITIPIFVGLSYEVLMGAQHTQDISISKIALSIFAIVTIPVLAGLLIRHLFEGLALKVESITGKLSTILFIIVLIGAIAKERHNIVPYFIDAGLITLALNLIMMILAYNMAKLLGTDTKQRIAISIECGLQNGTLAIAIASLLFGGGIYVIPAATYSLIMFVTSLAFVYWIRKKPN